VATDCAVCQTCTGALSDGGLMCQAQTGGALAGCVTTGL
jgi:hypothetical protein